MAIIFAGKPTEVGDDMELLFESTLVSVVKFFPCIYDPLNPDYNNMQQNKIAWSKLSNSLHKSVTECINKWYALLQIFLCLDKQMTGDESYSTWHHFSAMSKLRPKYPPTYAQLLHEKPPFLYSKPAAVQKEVLIKQMELHRKELLSVHVAIEQKQRIWLQIAQKLNSFYVGVNMPMIKWQKYWCDLKQSIIDMGKQGSVKSQIDDDDIKILHLFGLKLTDSMEQTVSALSSCIEIDCDMDKTVVNCSRCNVIKEHANQKFCDACGKLPNTFCDMCLRIYQSELTEYKVKDWNAVAKSILPPRLSSFSSISVCSACSTDLKRQAGSKWIACRICDSYIHPLDYLFSNENEVLRKAFMDATNITFTETDGLPSYICKVCKVQMQQFNNFYLKFSRVQSRLRDIQDEHFIGFPGLVLTKNAVNSNLSAAVNRVNVLKSNLNALSESGNNEQVNNGKPPASPGGVQKFTISSPSRNCSNVNNARKTKGKQITMPTGEIPNSPMMLNRVYAPSAKVGVPFQIPQGIGAGTDRPIITQIPPTLQIIKGLPPGTNIKAHQLSPTPGNGTVRPPQNRPILPKPQNLNTPANLPAPNKNLNIKPINVRTPPGSAPMPGNPNACTKEKLQPANRAKNTSTVSGIIAKQISNSPMLSSITIKTKSGTTTLSTTPTNIQANNPKVSTVITSTSSVTSANIQYNAHSRKNVYTQPQSTEPISVQSRKATYPQPHTTVFKIPDDMFDPNSPPAFCIPKSVSQVQIKPPTVIKVNCGHTRVDKVPQNTVPPEITPPTVNPSIIKTEIIDEDEPSDVVPSSNRNMPTPTHPPTVYEKPFQSPLNSFQSKTQSFGKTTSLVEKPKTDEGVKRPQQNPTQQPPPPPPPLPAPTAGSKRPRKYWGAVDEFHIPSKITNQTQSCSQIEIKEEHVDPEEVNTYTESSHNASFSNMFYPDAFELGNVSLDADVTNVLKHMIAHHQSSTDPDTYQFSNSSFMMSYNEKSNAAKNDESKGNIDPRPQVTNGASMTRSEPATSNESKPKDECEASDKVKVRFESKSFEDSKAQGDSKVLADSKAHADAKVLGDSKAHEDSKVLADSKTHGDAKGLEDSKALEDCKALRDSKTQHECKPSKETQTPHEHKSNGDCEPPVQATPQRELRTKIDNVVKDIPKEKKIPTSSTKFKKFHVKKLCIKLKRNKNLQSLVLGAIRSKVAPRSCTLSRRKSMRLNKSIL